MGLVSVGFKNNRAYNQLMQHSPEMAQRHLKDMFAQQKNRAKKMSVATEHVFYDYSRQRVTPETMKLLLELAEATQVAEKMEAMRTGEKINVTEKRAVLHVDLRSGKNREVQAVLAKIKAFSSEVLSGKRMGVTGKKLKNIVSIGIGGSYLGPEYLATALRPYAKEGMDLRFVANIDGTDFAEKTAGLNPEETLVIVVSKSFTTAETIQNARTARDWLVNGLNGHKDATKKHFIAVSTAKELVKEFGIDAENNMFGFWDWVGGRYSATSAVGVLPLSLYIGFENTHKILEGAYWMDQHYFNTPFERNIPVLSALLDIWNINFMGFKSRALLPYAQGLDQLPAHTQQVEMESNGKSVTRDGIPVDFQTGEVVFGQAGTNGQHSFYQLIHQGRTIIPCDFIGFISTPYPLGEATAKTVTHHQELNTNILAQADALAFGQENSNPAKVFHGNRPSSSMLLNELTPFNTGLLLAWTEHRAATKGFIWGINSFDQEGVQLGKVLGKDHRERILKFNADGTIDTAGLNASTARLLTAMLEGKLPT